MSNSKSEAGQRLHDDTPESKISNRRTYKKFLIVGSERTGSTYLQTLLQSHSAIQSYSEIFHLLSKYFNNIDSLIDITNDPVKFVNDTIYRTYPNLIQAVGYKLLYSEMGANNIFLYEMDKKDVDEKTRIRRDQFSKFMAKNIDLENVRKKFDEYLDHLKRERDIKIIHLKRSNRLQVFLSKKLASKSGAWNSQLGKYLLDPIHLNPSECLNFFEELDTLERKVNNLFQNHDVLEIEYHDLANNKSHTLLNILGFLGVEKQSLNSPLKKQHRLPICDSIINYLELKKYFSDTKWAKYLEIETQ